MSQDEAMSKSEHYFFGGDRPLIIEEKSGCAQCTVHSAEYQYISVQETYLIIVSKDYTVTGNQSATNFQIYLYTFL